MKPTFADFTAPVQHRSSRQDAALQGDSPDKEPDRSSSIIQAVMQEPSDRTCSVEHAPSPVFSHLQTPHKEKFKWN